ncbi:MAG: hypothetical protein U0Q15_10850 [Kineosporiaceae bacterium]
MLPARSTEVTSRTGPFQAAVRFVTDSAALPEWAVPEATATCSPARAVQPWVVPSSNVEDRTTPFCGGSEVVVGGVEVVVGDVGLVIGAESSRPRNVIA